MYEDEAIAALPMTGAMTLVLGWVALAFLLVGAVLIILARRYVAGSD